MVMRTKQMKMTFVGCVLCICLVASTAKAQMPKDQKVGIGNANVVEGTPRQHSMLVESGLLEQTASAALEAGDYAQAEADAQDALALNSESGYALRLLAEALDGQGKSQEALQKYQVMADMGTEAPRELLPYALLLLNAGHWKQAVAAYDKAVLHLPVSFVAPQNAAGLKFTANDEQQKALTAAIYLGEGIDENSRGEQRVKAFRNYEKALKLEPDSSLTNYYYGHGWQNLAPKERAKLAAKPGQREAVKAALEKAATLGTGEVQTQAKAELKQLR